MEDCVFCKIANGEIPTNVVYEDDKIIAFNDAEPTAPVHVLFIPKKHISNLNEITEEDSKLIAHIFYVISQNVEKLGLQNGYRVVSNCGEDGGQSVQHIHFHVLGGREMLWPAGWYYEEKDSL